MSHAVISSPIGNLLIVEDQNAIIKIELTIDEIAPATSSLLLTAIKQLEDYFSGSRQSFNFPVFYNGTDFQVKVWKALREIEFGNTASYQDIALDIGHDKAYRAVGSACNKNPLLIVVPCHRIVGKNNPGGFAHGIEMKNQLQKIENV